MLCTDIDLLRWEPHLAAEASFSTQTLLRARPARSAAPRSRFPRDRWAARVRAGFIACVSGAISGCFPILSIDSETTCTLSVIYDGLDETPAAPVSPGAGAGLTVAIRSFYPQRRIVSDLLMRMARCGAGRVAIDRQRRSIPQAVRSGRFT